MSGVFSCKTAVYFLHHWNFPNCVGSIDGMHVVIQAPNKSESLFSNYKGTFSIVLLAVVDAKYCFQITDFGSYLRSSDGGILANSPFGWAFQEPSISRVARSRTPWTPASYLHGRWRLPPPMWPDETLSKYATPWEEKGLHLQAFMGKVGSQGCIWYSCSAVANVSLGHANAETCVKATCILHNFLWRTRPGDPSFVSQDAKEASALQIISKVLTNNVAWEAIHVWETFATYFCAKGAISWQPATWKKQQSPF